LQVFQKYIGCCTCCNGTHLLQPAATATGAPCMHMESGGMERGVAWCNDTVRKVERDGGRGTGSPGLCVQQGTGAGSPRMYMQQGIGAGTGGPPVPVAV
jgi:hypothetical protein